MRTSLAALALGITAVMVPSSANAYTASFEVEDYQLEGQCVNHTFDANFDAEGATESGQLTVTITDPEMTVVHTFRSEVKAFETRRENMEMTFCRYNMVPGTYTLDGTFETPVQARRVMNPVTFEVTRATVEPTPPPVTSSMSTGFVKVREVPRGIKVVFEAGTIDQRWKVRVKGTTRNVKLEAGERAVKVYRGAKSVKIKTFGVRVF
jgi:hypothetical protein